MAKITCIETYFPEKIINNKDLEGIVDGYDADKITKKLAF